MSVCFVCLSEIVYSHTIEFQNISCSIMLKYSFSSSLIDTTELDSWWIFDWLMSIIMGYYSSTCIVAITVPLRIFVQICSFFLFWFFLMSTPNRLLKVSGSGHAWLTGFDSLMSQRSFGFAASGALAPWHRAKRPHSTVPTIIIITE